MKNKNAKYLIEKLEEWFHELIDCTATFEHIKERYKDHSEINLSAYELDELFKKMINCMKHEIRAVLNMMQFWYGKN